MKRVNWSAPELRSLINRHRFPFAIAGVAAVAILMTTISLSLYVSSGTSRLDLSRPGFEQARQEVKPAPTESFSKNGPVDKSSLDEFDALLQKQRKYINNLGDFQDTSLDDVSLRLAP